MCACVRVCVCVHVLTCVGDGDIWMGLHTVIAFGVKVLWSKSVMANFYLCLGRINFMTWLVLSCLFGFGMNVGKTVKANFHLRLARINGMYWLILGYFFGFGVNVWNFSHMKTFNFAFWQCILFWPQHLVKITWIGNVSYISLIGSSSDIPVHTFKTFVTITLY